MQVTIRVRGQEELSKAMRRVPRALYRELKGEMEKLAVDYKVGISGTFRGNTSRSTLKGRKWLYSKRASSQKSNQLRHFVAGKDLDSLHLGIFTRSNVVAGHIKPRTIRPTKSQYLAIPLPAAFSARGGTGGKTRFGPRGLANPEVIKVGGELFVIERARSTRADIAEGEPIFFFKLVPEIHLEGGRLTDFNTVISNMDDVRRKRFAKAAKAALRTAVRSKRSRSAA